MLHTTKSTNSNYSNCVPKYKYERIHYIIIAIISIVVYMMGSDVRYHGYNIVAFGGNVTGMHPTSVCLYICSLMHLQLMHTQKY